MTTCQRCLGEKTLPTLRLVGKRWLPIVTDPCPDCQGTGVKIEPTCRYCGMHLSDGNNGPYCNDVCQHKALRSITMDNKRFQIKCVVASPEGGWEFGENVTITRKGYIIDVRIGLGGCVMSRIRKAGASIEGGLITVEKRN